MKRIFSMFVGLAVALSALQAQNAVTVSDVSLQVDETAVVSVELTNDTEFTAFQMDLTLPEGFAVATTVDEDGEEVLDIALNADRKRSSHSLSYNVLADGTIRFAAFSNTNATFKGTSGALVEFRIVATEDAVIGDHVAMLTKVLFTTPEAVDLNLGTVTFGINYSEYVPVNIASVNQVTLRGVGSKAVLAVDLQNETEFTALLMKLKLPTGFVVPTMVNEDEEEVLDITLHADRKRSSHSLSCNVLPDGTILFAAFSNTNATFKGTSGTIVEIALMATEEAVESEWGWGNWGTLEVSFTTPDAVDYNLGTLGFSITYSRLSEADVNLSLTNGQYGRCILNGNVILPEEQYVAPLAPGSRVTMYFVPFNEYMLKSMKRNGEVVTVRDNYYEEVVSEDVTYTDLRFEAIVDTLIITETVVKVDTVVVEKVTVDTVIITEIEELPIPVITCEGGVVTITCEDADVTILYAINGDPLEGSVYAAPFEVKEDAVVSAVAVRSGEQAELSVTGTGVAQSQMRVVARRYYKENGVEVTSPEAGTTIVVAEYEDGSTRVYKMVKR